MHFHDPALLAPTGIYNSSLIVQAFHESAIKSLQQVKTQLLILCLHAWALNQNLILGLNKTL